MGARTVTIGGRDGAPGARRRPMRCTARLAVRCEVRFIVEVSGCTMRGGAGAAKVSIQQ